MAWKKEYDVVVAGGGPGGFSAAAAAAKRGASVLLIERYGFLGGMATAGLVNPFMGYKIKKKSLSSPVFNEVISMMESENAIDSDGRVFDDEVLKVVLDRLMSASGVDVLLHSYAAGVSVKDNKIKRLNLRCKQGGVSVKGKIFIDSTGDGDLAASAGCLFEKGRARDGLCQPMTLCFRIAGIAEPEGAHACSFIREELNRIFLEAKEYQQINQPRENVLVFKTLVPGNYHFNTTRIIGLDGTDSSNLSLAEIEGRRQAYELYGLFRRKSLRFSNSYISKIAAQTGVRETRRISGMYCLKQRDILTARKFKDGIAKSNYPVDIHNPSGEGTVMKRVPAGDYYEVPFRSLIPAAIENLLIGSRCVSSTHEAHSSLRVMPVVSAIGEAAGIAAAEAVKKNLRPADVSGAWLKREIFK